MLPRGERAADDGGGDSGDGSWSSEIGGAPSSMLGMAEPATVPG